ncbi:hypothetical protein [Paraburkholderia sediminicola]|uniref:hypothetical protein n=1 Tax=Paraburkholderia sediminicola TaxID=458836 RepID=UPI0038BC981D
MDKDFRARLRKAINSAPDMRVPVSPSGYVPPALGIAGARLVGYFELGTHEEEFEGRTRDREKVDLVFELSGPNHEPRKLDDGTLIPHRITVQETLSLEPLSNFFRLFADMNRAHGDTCRHMVELLGSAFLVEVFHRNSKDGKKVYANLKGSNGYKVYGTTARDPISGKEIVVEVPGPFTEPRYFIWETADQEMWDSIHIPGEWEACKNGKGEIISPARSKNIFQDKIRKAKNWKDHPLAAIVG